jgi:hypothetical protein
MVLILGACRVYNRTAAAGDKPLLVHLESQAVATAILTTVLSRSDAEYIEAHLTPHDRRGTKPVVRKNPSLLGTPAMSWMEQPAMEDMSSR